MEKPPAFPNPTINILMNNCNIDRSVVDRIIDEAGITDFARITIRDIADLSRAIESATGLPFIHLEMGVPGLQPPAIGLAAEQEALQSGAAAIYPPTGGISRLKKAASRFIKAFVGINVSEQGCIATVGSMQGTYAVLTALRHACPQRDTVLFIDPGFPVQKTQADIIGLKYVSFDIHDCRGPKMLAAIEKIFQRGDICAIVYSNPNNPAWICFNEEELQGIGALATRHEVIVLEDLAYFGMDFRQDLAHPFMPPYQASVACYTDNYVLAISGSKAFSYAGQRIGTIAISDRLFARHYEPLHEKFGVAAFGSFFINRVLYTLSSGVTHSAQYALAAMMEAAADGTYKFLDDLREYGNRARFMKKTLLENGFYLVYDNDLGAPLADGFYFTAQYPGMTATRLTRELLFYGISVFPLNTMGSRQEGVRICTSFITEAQFSAFEERIRLFHRQHPL